LDYAVAWITGKSSTVAAEQDHHVQLFTPVGADEFVLLGRFMGFCGFGKFSGKI